MIGILNKDGSIDIERNSQIVNMARQHGLGVTFHRAFDVCADKETRVYKSAKIIGTHDWETKRKQIKIINVG